MKTYEFTLVLDSSGGVSDKLEDALFEAGCDDALLSFRNGIAFLDFDREADNLEKAVISAIHQVEQTGLPLSVKRVEPSDFVTSAEMARRLHRSKQSVQQIISGGRGDGSFPLPIAGVTAKTMLWSWQEVVGWFLDKNKLADKSIYENATSLKQLNESLDARNNEAQIKSIRRITKLIKKGRSEFV
ncbi:MAG: hypothetical protein ACNA8K_17510 [Cyclonatronaceae bacterium]|jgi:hypothetical protein